MKYNPEILSSGTVRWSLSFFFDEASPIFAEAFKMIECELDSKYFTGGSFELDDEAMCEAIEAVEEMEIDELRWLYGECAKGVPANALRRLWHCEITTAAAVLRRIYEHEAGVAAAL